MKRTIPVLLLLGGCASTVENYNPLSYYGIATSASPSGYPDRPRNYSDHPKETILVWEEESFSAEDKWTIQQTLDTWNVVLNGYIHLAHTDDPTKAQWTILQMQRFQLPPGSPDLAFVDEIAGSKLTVVRDRFLSQRAFFEGVLHEEAHLLGALHQEGERGEGLMHGKFNLTRYRCADYWTVRQIAIVHSLDVNQLNFCSTITAK